MDLCGIDTRCLWVGCNNDADQKEIAGSEVEPGSTLVAVAQRSFVGRGDHHRIAMVDHCLSFHRRYALRADALSPTLLSFVESDVPHRAVCDRLVCVVHARAVASHRRFNVCCSGRVLSRTLHPIVAMVVYCGETCAAL